MKDNKEDFLKALEVAPGKNDYEKLKHNIDTYVKEVVEYDTSGEIKKEGNTIIAAQNKATFDFNSFGSLTFDTLISSIRKYFGPKKANLKMLYDVLIYFIKERDQLTKVKIPEIMESLNIDSFTTPEGVKVSIDTKNNVFVKKGKEEDWYKFLIKQGYGDSIKANLSLVASDFTEELKNFLFERGLSYERKDGMHWKTQEKVVNTILEEKGIQIFPGEDVVELVKTKKAKIKI